LVANEGLGVYDEVWIAENPIDAVDQAEHIGALEIRGVCVVGDWNAAVEDCEESPDD
jgi:hypothetical protein